MEFGYITMIEIFEVSKARRVIIGYTATVEIQRFVYFLSKIFLLVAKSVVISRGQLNLVV